MLDSDLAALYGVFTKRLNEQVSRNIKRFPEDFMFQLTSIETANLKSQIATSSLGWGGRRKTYRAFTQEGVAMLSGVLKSSRAIDVNIAIMRAFVKFRQELSLRKELAVRLTDIENKILNHDQQLKKVFKRFVSCRHLLLRRRASGFNRAEPAVVCPRVIRGLRAKYC